MYVFKRGPNARNPTCLCFYASLCLKGSKCPSRLTHVNAKPICFEGELNVKDNAKD